MMTCLAFFLLGVFEDLRGSLTARVRFLSMLAIGSATMYFAPSLALEPVGIIWVDVILTSSYVNAVAFSALCIAFIPNALTQPMARMVGGWCECNSAAAFVQPTADSIPFMSAAFVGCLLFLVFNLISGRFFLGDGGAYFLGALCGLSMTLSVTARTCLFGGFWLWCSIRSRICFGVWQDASNGASPFAADDQHFYNFCLLTWTPTSEHSAVNTITGVSIGPQACRSFDFTIWAVQDSVWLVGFAPVASLWRRLEIFERSALRVAGCPGKCDKEMADLEKARGLLHALLEAYDNSDLDLDLVSRWVHNLL